MPRVVIYSTWVYVPPEPGKWYIFPCCRPLPRCCPPLPPVFAFCGKWSLSPSAHVTAKRPDRLQRSTEWSRSYPSLLPTVENMETTRLNSRHDEFLAPSRSTVVNGTFSVWSSFDTAKVPSLRTCLTYKWPASSVPQQLW